MEHPRGKIVSIVDDGRERRAVVDVDVAAICRRCAEGRGCGAGLYGSSAGHRRIEARLDTESALGEGDVVEIVLAPRNVLAAAAMVYGWPLAGAGIGAGIAAAASLGDAGAAMLALAGLLSGIAVVRRRAAGQGCLERFVPQVLG